MARTNGVKVRGVLYAMLLGMTAMMLAYAGPSSAQTAAANSPPTDADFASVKCAIGMEKFLPADYYYCLAGQRYGLHDYGQAQRFFHEAASWASKPAQYVLGVMALHGDQQPVDKPLALAWFALAAERHTERFSKAYQDLDAQLSAEDRRKAAKLLHDLQPRYGDATAASRAETRYRDGMRLLRQTANQSNYCIAGMYDFRDLAGTSTGKVCPPTQVVVNQIDKTAANVFEDWHGHVTVGPLQQVPRPGRPDKSP
jgi:hypothetical protein